MGVDETAPHPDTPTADPKPPARTRRRFLKLAVGALVATPVGMGVAAWVKSFREKIQDAADHVR